MTRGRVFALVLIGVASIFGWSQLPEIGAGALLHPSRHHVSAGVPPACQPVTFTGAAGTLAGWTCAAPGPRRGTLVYLHGIADNRASGAGLIQRFNQRGFDVIAYDSRAHGESAGESCTYGFFEKDDLGRVLDTVTIGPIVLIGTSLGAAVALQQTARDSRVNAVVAAEPFSDLRTVATERAPFVFTAERINRALELAEARGHFQMDAVSPMEAARAITVPVLLVHGADDTDTSPEHARRIFAALGGPKRLILVPGAGHNESLRGDVWNEIERWIDAVVPAAAR